MAEEPKRRGSSLGLAAILAGIVLGAAFGLIYGRQMWLASDGPEKRLVKLEKTIGQKGRFADEADAAADRLAAEGKDRQAQRKRAEADGYRQDVTAIRQEIRRVEAVKAQAEKQDLRTAFDVATIVDFLGDVFLRALRMMVVPLVFTSMVCGITSLGDIRRLGKVGGWTVAYYVATGAAAVLVGIILVSVIRPGTDTDDTFAYVEESVLAKEQPTLLGTLLEVVRGPEGDPAKGMVPENIFLAAGDTNVLGVIVFALVFGGALSTLGARGKPAIDFFHAANDAIMKMVHLIIFFAPVGIFGLVATKIAESGGAGGFWEELVRLVWFVVTVLSGLGIHVAVLGLVLLVFARRNPLTYFYGVARALLTALSTASSSATLPVTMECVEEMDVSERSAGFVLPLGATINMDGTALYEATAAIFIAQSAGIPLSGGALVIIFITATLAAVGAPGIPEAGLVTLLIVLTAVGLPAAGIGTILAIDWFLDRNRTAVNVFGDSVGAAIIDRHFGGK